MYMYNVCCHIPHACTCTCTCSLLMGGTKRSTWLIAYGRSKKKTVTFLFHPSPSGCNWPLHAQQMEIGWAEHSNEQAMEHAFNCPSQTRCLKSLRKTKETLLYPSDRIWRWSEWNQSLINSWFDPNRALITKLSQMVVVCWPRRL